MTARRLAPLGTLLGLLVLAGLLALPVRAQGAVWYVSRASAGGDGSSWDRAWPELNGIDWSRVQAGDVIEVDGGPVACPPLGDEPAGCGLVYHTQLAWGRDGVTVRLASEAGRSGTAIFDGNQTRFTYCADNTPMPSPPTSPNGAPLGTVVTFNGRSDVTLDGTKWGGIVVRNGVTYGINLGGGDRNTVRYVKVHHINNPDDTSNNSVGVTHGWTAGGLVVEHVEVYRIGQDALRVAGDDFTLRGSYIHDLYCNHPDGVQAFVPTANSDVPDSEGRIDNLTITGNVFERVGLQAIFLGENTGHQSWVDGAHIADNLFLAGRYIVKTKHRGSTGFVIEHNTFAGSSEFAIEWCCGGASAPMTIRDNIFANTRNPAGTGFWLPTTGGAATFTDNCLWQAGGVAGGALVAGTVNVASDPLREDPATGCAGKGSVLESAMDLLPTVTVTETPTNTVTPTATETPTPTVTVAPTATPTPNCLRLADGLLCHFPYTATP